MLSFFSDPFSQLKHAGTDAEVHMQLILKDDEGSRGTVPEWIPLDNHWDDYERGQTDIHKGQILKKANQKIRDYAEFYPDNFEIQIVLELTAKWYTDKTWGTDLLKLYFAGKNGKDVVLRCYAGVQWISDGNKYTFNCTKLEDNNPARSIEMFEAHTCDWLYSGSSDETMKLKFCQKREQFRSFNESSKDLHCCSTNHFPLGSTRNEYKRYDVISRKDVLDGGAVLGKCEGFDLLGTKIYVGKWGFKVRN